MTDDEIFEAWCASRTGETLQEFTERLKYEEPIVLSGSDFVVTKCVVRNTPGVCITISEAR